MKRVKEQPKSCERCGVIMQRKRYGKQLEDLTAYRRRRFCSLSCANTKTRLTKHGYSWRARKHLKDSCETCFSTQDLQAHHIDQSITNNNPENIQTLCKTCHSFWHGTARRRGWKIAGRMPVLDWDGRMGFQGWLMGYLTGHTELKPSETP